MTAGLRNVSRRSLIAGAGFATAAPALVRADSLLDLPGDPLTRRGLSIASKWATEEFSEYPASRIVFSDGSSYRWMIYSCPERWVGSATKPPKPVAYAIAVEVITTDDAGKRFITSVPVNGVRLAQNKKAAQQRADTLAQRMGWV